MAGRPSKYDSHVKPKLLLIEAWARDGLTEADICKNLDVSNDSFIEYKKQYPELVETLKNGKEVIDVQVENALLKAALGYEYEEDGIGKDGVYRLTKYAHPNTTALIFWLKNRKSKVWKDKHEIDGNMSLTIKVGMPPPPGDTDDED